MVPSLRGRIVLSVGNPLRIRSGPVPTGTDCSSARFKSSPNDKSRPYGDGLFCKYTYEPIKKGVPSLRGRIVLTLGYQKGSVWSPVPTGTVPFCRCFWTARVGPVPTGTDCSINICATTDDHRSRPYGDGLFRGQQDDLSFYNGPVPTGTDCSIAAIWVVLSRTVPSLLGRIVLIFR